MRDCEEMSPPAGEAGQALLQLILILSFFVLPVLGFSVDLTNMWFHRQAVQTAADSACQAGALDLLASASGVSAPNSSFTSFVGGTANNCVSLPGASLCKYAGFNGYVGAGFSASSVSNSVSWTFPASVAGVVKPGSSQSAHPFLQVVIEENVKTWFLGLVGKKYVPVAAACTCGLANVMGAPPVVVLDPTSSASLEFGGGAVIKLVGGSQRSIQVNSSSTTAVQCDPSGEIDLSAAGSAATGGDLGTYGGPSANPTCYGSAYENLALNPGTTGAWRSNAMPVADPFGGVAAPSIPATSPTGTNTNAEIVAYGKDGCPDHSPTNYVGATTPHSGCILLEPGYYPSGVSLAANDVVIFKPGLYYFNGSLNIGGSDEVRPATPCVPSCSPYSTAASQQTDGVIFYFASGQLSVSGGSGALSSSRVDAINATALTCDGSSPPAALGVPATLNGNALVAQCAAGGTYWDAAGDTSDSRGNPGSRGILVFQGHNNPAISATFSGSGTLAYAGSMYYHSTTGSMSSFSINGGAGTTSYVMGNIVADKINLSGSGKINMQLNATPSVGMLKAGLFQ